MTSACDQFDVVVVGGGHAGAEAAWACSGAGLRVGLVTLDPSRIGVMSCNPAIGGLAKGQIVREVDALGGLMGLAADATGIMFKVLNTSKGPAVRGPRVQCDRHAYARQVQQLLMSRDGIEFITGAAERFAIEEFDGRRICRGVVIVQQRDDGEMHKRELHADAVILTTGTFMRGLMHEGARQTQGGRVGEAPANSISGTLRELGFELGRLKTGTPPRVIRSSIDWDGLDAQAGDESPLPFSDLTDLSQFPVLEQIDCRVTSTTPAIHELIRANLHRAPMYSGQIRSAGPRYCPSIEDKVVRFAQRESHHVFLEPESHESDWVYCNGISTSLPSDLQEQIVRGMSGCERAEIAQFGYAVEYDMVRPHQIQATGQTKLVGGLFLAGQINGTSGYEEAAGQGVIAAMNVIRRLRGDDPLMLGREQAYIGVMMDDLVTKTPREPYRMFTSRAEHRLLLRADNASDRLTPIGREHGLVCDERWRRQLARQEAISAINTAIDTAIIEGETLARRVKRPDYSPADLERELGCSLSALGEGAIVRHALFTVLADRQYAGYVIRQQAQTKRQAQLEERQMPGWFEPSSIVGLRTEAREALTRFRPSTLGQAGRLEGVNPADLTLVVVAIERAGRERRAAQAASSAMTSSGV